MVRLRSYYMLNGGVACDESETCWVCCGACNSPLTAAISNRALERFCLSCLCAFRIRYSFETGPEGYLPHFKPYIESGSALHHGVRSDSSDLTHKTTPILG